MPDAPDTARPPGPESPLRAHLARAGVELPRSDRPVVVVAPPGVGKTTLLVLAALDALQAGGAVLHVAVHDSVDHVRGHYDLALKGAAPVDLTRRMIHSDRALTVERLGAHVALLAQAAGFRPTLLVVDGLDGTSSALRADLEALARLAAGVGAQLWASARPDVGSSPSLPDGAFGLALHPEGAGVRLAVIEGGNERLLDLALGPDGALTSAAAGPAPVARPTPADVTLYAGGAAGTEAVFGELAERWGLGEVNFTFPGHVQARTRQSVELSERELKAGDVSLAYVSRRLQRTYSTEGTLIRKVLQTLWQMVSRSQKVLVVGEIQADGTVVGGTGWSVELARMWNKDLWVYDQTRRGWFTWSVDQWVPGTCVIDTATVAGTGTRYLEPHGRAALEELFHRSFGPPPN